MRTRSVSSVPKCWPSRTSAGVPFIQNVGSCKRTIKHQSWPATAMAHFHYVRQGEYLAMIARTYGFTNSQTIWDAPENKGLKEKRKNPNILFPNDELFIPDRQTKEQSRPTETRHRFKVKFEKLRLRIVLTDSKNKPFDGHECTLLIEGEPHEISTKSDGLLAMDISEKTGQGKVRDRGHSSDEPRITREIPLQIGHLHPVDEISGQIGRLNNLGYLAGDPGIPLGTPDEEPERHQQLQSAIEEFQCDFELKVDGICGKKTQDKLAEVHGC